MILPPPEVEDDLTALCEWAVRVFGARLRLAHSLANEDMVLLHALGAAAKALPASERPSAFLLDTGRLHDASYRFVDRIRERLPELELRVTVPRTERLEQLYVEQGTYGFRSSLAARKACCDARKVEPLGRALAGADAWMTGMRRAQSPTRAALPLAEVDPEGRLKLAPLANWSSDRVVDYLRQHNVPKHPLYAEGFASIGCEPCTRAIAPGEAERAGRWWWESADSKECGLHTIRRTREA